MKRLLLDNDLYKFSMSYSYMKLYPEAEGTFTFCDRNKTIYTDEYVDLLNRQLYRLRYATMSKLELDWVIKAIPYIPSWYWEWLHNFQFNPSNIKCYLDSDKHLCISVTDKMYKVTLYEVPILAMISESYYNYNNISEPDKDLVISNVRKKIDIAEKEGFKFSEFGTRRRFSFNVQDYICEELCKHSCCAGTSNVYFAFKYNMLPMGTMAHEWIMFHGSHYSALEGNYMALKAWVKVFDGALGIALTDTYTSDIFFKNFTKQHAKLFDGIRQDSGDEYEFIVKALYRYEQLGIDPQTKTIVFSNALDFEKAAKISQACKNRIKCSFGIGTNLTNDIEGVKPMNIVMKLTQCRMNERQSWKPCVKISDDNGKVMGESFEVQKILHDIKL